VEQENNYFRHSFIYPYMQFKRAVIVLTGCLLTLSSVAQEKNKIRYGKISPDDFQKTRYELDTGAHAVVLADVGATEFEAFQSDLRLVYTRYRRVKILDKTGYEAANESIDLYVSGNDEEKVSNLKAVTYNLENGKVVDTRMDSKSIFTEELDKNHRARKFTLPAVKEGSIIEYTYTVSSPFIFNLQPWAFQGEYPILWSEYTAAIPEFYEYVFISQGYHPLAGSKDESQRTFPFRVSASAGYGEPATSRTEQADIKANITTYHWVAKEVPALKEEAFTTSINNHITKIDFQLASIRPPGGILKPVMGSWPKLAEDLLKEESYGGALDKNNGYMSDVVDGLTQGAASDEEKARRIFSYVRNNFTCSDHSALYMDKSMKTVFTTKNGNVTDINLLLVAMLRKAGLKAYPVLLSTRSHGLVNTMYPILGRFNYTIAEVELGNNVAYLDAAYPLGFGRLHTSCYNGHARIMDTDATPTFFSADSLLEQKTTSVILAPGENGALKGTFQQRPSYFESYNLRGLIREKGKEECFKTLAKGYPKLSNTSLSNTDDLDQPLGISYEFEWQPGEEDMVYLNPMFGEATKTNPFKSATRFYPVEMPATFDEVYTMNLEIPAGYEVEELPKSAMVQFNEDEGLFQYLIAKNDNYIQFRSRVKLNKALFMPDEYESLRDFFDMIVKKQGEQIVLKKKK
jgi:transglutaminase-like putative cysteine protease